MANIPKIEAHELLFKYQNHPELIDIFVEGEFDRDFICLFLDESNNSALTTIHPINGIDIPNDVVTALNLNHGSNKFRVIAMANLLDNEFAQRPTNVTCIVDADNDRIRNTTHSFHHLKYTDYSCMEMYLFNKATLKKFLTFSCKLNAIHVDQFILNAELILTAQFALRAVNDELLLNTKIPHFGCALNKKKDIHSFDVTKFLNSYIQIGQLTKKKAEITQSFDDFMTKLANENILNKANGHDFLEFLFYYIWENDGIRLHNKNDDVIKFGGRLLTTALDIKSLFAHPLFSLINEATLGRKLLCS